MPRSLTLAAVALCFAVLAAVAAALLPGDLQRVALALFASAAAISVGVAILLLSGGGRRRDTHRRAATAESPLSRLDYLPTVTTRTRRLQWRGGRYVIGSHPDGLRVQNLTGSAYRPPASSTRPPQTDGVEASPRAW